MPLAFPRKAQQVRKLKFNGHVHIPIKGQCLQQPQGCSFLTPFSPHEGISASWLRQSWWLSAQHHARWKHHSSGTHVALGMSLTSSNPAPGRLAHPAKHIQGKQGHGVGFPALHWQCWIFFVLYYQRKNKEFYYKSKQSCATFCSQIFNLLLPILILICEKMLIKWRSLVWKHYHALSNI